MLITGEDDKNVFRRKLRKMTNFDVPEFGPHCIVTLFLQHSLILRILVYPFLFLHRFLGTR